MATATFWNGLFASTGDAIDVDQLRSLAPKANLSKADIAAATSSASASEAFVPTGSGSDALAIGDVVAAKISNIKVLADASGSSKVLGTVSKTDELVVTSAPKNGFVMVEGASVRGWVSLTLIAKEQ